MFVPQQKTDQQWNQSCETDQQCWREWQRMIHRIKRWQWYENISDIRITGHDVWDTHLSIALCYIMLNCAVSGCTIYQFHISIFNDLYWIFCSCAWLFPLFLHLTLTWNDLKVNFADFQPALVHYSVSSICKWTVCILSPWCLHQKIPVYFIGVSIYTKCK